MIFPFLPSPEKDGSKNIMNEAIELHNILFYTNCYSEHYCLPHKSPFGIIFSIEGLNILVAVDKIPGSAIGI